MISILFSQKFFQTYLKLILLSVLMPFLVHQAWAFSDEEVSIPEEPKIETKIDMKPDGKEGLRELYHFCLDDVLYKGVQEYKDYLRPYKRQKKSYDDEGQLHLSYIIIFKTETLSYTTFKADLLESGKPKTCSKPKVLSAPKQSNK